MAITTTLSNYLLDPGLAQRDPRAAQGDLIRKQWDLFASRYRPLEEQAAGLISRDIEPEVARAGQTVAGFHDRSGAVRERWNDRYGLNLGAQAREQTRRSSGLQKALDIAATKNNLRRSWDDERLQKMGELIGIGKNASGGAGDSLSSAAGLATARAQQGEAARRAADAEAAQTRNTLLGAGLTAALFMI